MALTLLLSACGGGSDGSDGLDGHNGLATLTLVSNEAVGLNCASGGARIDAGLDSNANGTLDAAEVGSTQYVCNGSLGNGSGGANGANGSNGLTSLVSVVAEAPGGHCVFGGSSVNAGLDDNGNNTLESAEVDSVGYVCQGAAGAAGPAGAPGNAGINSLIAIVAEPAGAHCTYGGNKATSGLDGNGNGMLDPSEAGSPAYTCNGAPGPGVSWLDITANSVLAQANMGYVANSATQVAVTLPPSSDLRIGDVVRVSGLGAGGWSLTQNAAQTVVTKALPASYLNTFAWTAHASVRSWTSVASSSDGNKLAAVANTDLIYTSTDSGTSWTPHGSTRIWLAVASSADGSKLVAVARNDNIYTSADSGLTWTARESSRNWIWVASSADGSKLVAVESLGRIYLSTDSGVTWAPADSVRTWVAVASSDDGSKLVAAAYNGNLYTSTDSGATWAPRDTGRPWGAVASSADGSKLVAVAVNGFIYTSTDSGLTWAPQASAGARNWWSVASSADGSKLVAVVRGGQTYTSTDSGSTWTARDVSRGWFAVASSSDGNKLVGAAQGGNVYTMTASPDRTTAGATGSVSGSQFDALELQYLGSGTFLPLSFNSYSGSFVVH